MAKKIILLISLIILYGILLNYKIKGAFLSKIDLKLDNDEIGIIISDKSNFFLIKRNEENTLLVYNDINKDDVTDLFDVFAVNELHNLITLNDFYINSDKQYDIRNTNLKFLSTKLNQNIIDLYFYDYKFCIYKKGENSDLDNCTFVYFSDISEDVTINDKNKVVFYNKDISEDFKEELYTKWIDIYTIDNSSYTILKIKKDNYNIINIPK